MEMLLWFFIHNYLFEMFSMRTQLIMKKGIHAAGRGKKIYLSPRPYYLDFVLAQIRFA